MWEWAGPRFAVWLANGSVPLSLFAADSNAAMLYASGSARVNGGPRTPSDASAIFSGDLLSKHAPILSPTSTNPAPRSESYPIPWFNLKETQSKLSMAGDLTVSTSKGMATTAGDVKVELASECVD